MCFAKKYVSFGYPYIKRYVPEGQFHSMFPKRFRRQFLILIYKHIGPSFIGQFHHTVSPRSQFGVRWFHKTAQPRKWTNTLTHIDLKCHPQTYVLREAFHKMASPTCGIYHILVSVKCSIRRSNLIVCP